MAEITRKRTGEFLRKLFEILMHAPDGLPAREALAALVAQVTLSSYEAGTYESGDRRFEKIVRFATVDCVKAGWMQKNKGIWTVTEEGMAAHRELKDPEQFQKAALKLYRKWKLAQKNDIELARDDGIEQEDVAEKETSITFEQAEEQAWSEIEQHLRAMNPYVLQQLVADLLKAMSYHVSWISPPGKDGGIDILAYTDPLGARPPRIKVQVKRTEQKVSTDSLRAFISLIGNEDVGLFVSTGGFTRDAETLARMQETRKITLIDMNRLTDLWIEFYGKLDEQARQRLPLTPIYFLTPST
ncbi:restriction endonuclease [Herbaspirillum sp. RV1423]|uniref:restriction endonuclease n=1 Tax=Herbaspirillum sp. RV1423 TaxID=1443993 RepID=UPI0004AC8B71|nr:restriction endonuclease [Herbaspirillum sp. RV1423]